MEGIIFVIRMAKLYVILRLMGLSGDQTARVINRILNLNPEEGSTFGPRNIQKKLRP